MGVCVLYLSPYTVMGLYLAFSLYEQFPFKSHPVLTLP